MNTAFNTYNKLKIVISHDWIANKNMVGYPIKPVVMTGYTTIETKQPCVLSVDTKELLFLSGETIKLEDGNIESIKIIN